MPPGRQTARLALGLLAAALTTAAIWPAQAHAERRRVRLSVAPVYALAIVDQRQPSGGGVVADLGFGLTDALSLRATGFVSFHAAPGLSTTSPTTDESLTGPAGTISAFGAFAGAHYELDVLRIVPSFDLGVGALGLRGDSRFGTGASASALLPQLNAFALELGFGVDWLITRTWSVGVVARYYALLTALERAPGFLYVGPRVSLTLPF